MATNNANILIGIQLNSTQKGMDEQIKEIQKLATKAITLDVKVNVTKKDILAQLSKVTEKSMGEVTVQLKVDTGITYIRKQIQQLSDKIAGELSVKLKIDATGMKVETEKIKKQMADSVGAVTVKESWSPKPTTVLKADQASITKSILETLGVAEGKISKIQTEMNKDWGINKAIVSYTNSADKAVTETLTWIEVMNKATGVKERLFTTTSVKTVDDFKKAETEAHKLNNTMTDLQRKLTSSGTSDSSISKNVKEYERLQTEIKQLSSVYGNYDQQVKQIERDTKSLTVSQNSYNAVNERSIMLAQKSIFSGTSSGHSPSAIQADISRYLEQSKYANQTFSPASIKQVPTGQIATISSVEGNKIRELKFLVDSLTQSYHLLTDETKKASNKDLGFAGQLQNAAKAFPIWMIAATAWMQTLNQIRKGISDIIELDSSLARLKMTMNATDAEFQGMVKSAQDMALAMGTSVKNVLDAAKVYANMNESIASILEKTKADIMIANLTGQNITQTTDSIQAIMNQFEMTTEGSAQRIADTLTKVSANMAMDFGKLLLTKTEMFYVT